MEDRFFMVLNVLKRCLEMGRREEERMESAQILKKHPFRKVLDQCRDTDFLQEKWKEYEKYSSGKAYVEFKKRIKVQNHRRLFIRWGAIAALFLLAFAGWEWRKNLPVEQPFEKVRQAVIQPGIKKAQLKLADGSIVNIQGDSMQIKEKQGVDIAYTEGTISYQTAQKVTELVFNELIVPIAGECFITLEDGSRVWVNADSKLRYPVKFVGEERKVFLEGEAYFEVTPNEKPFIVHTAYGDIRVLGTVFDVKAYPLEKVNYTTLVSGKVEFVGEQVMQIEPGEQVVSYSDGRVEKRQVDISEYIGWKNGLYVFKRQSLENIMNDLARWYNVKVFYQTSLLKSITFTGNLKRYDNINAFLELLERTGEVKYNIDGNTIILYK